NIRTYHPLITNILPTTIIYNLSLHDALPIFKAFGGFRCQLMRTIFLGHILELSEKTRLVVKIERLGKHQHIPDLTGSSAKTGWIDRKSTRLNSSHVKISYAVFCLKKKKRALK